MGEYLEQMAQDFGYTLRDAGDHVFATRQATGVQWSIPKHALYAFLMS